MFLYRSDIGAISSISVFLWGQIQYWTHFSLNLCFSFSYEIPCAYEPHAGSIFLCMWALFWDNKTLLTRYTTCAWNCGSPCTWPLSSHWNIYLPWLALESVSNVDYIKWRLKKHLYSWTEQPLDSQPLCCNTAPGGHSRTYHISKSSKSTYWFYWFFSLENPD